MIETNWFGKFLIMIGILFIILGMLSLFAEKIHLLGRLPGDIYVQKKNFNFYFPLTSAIAINIALSLILRSINRK